MDSSDFKGIQGNSIKFSINGKSYSVDATTPNVDAESKLVDFIRDSVHLKGTKTMCREGGCGACVVSVKTKDPLRGTEHVKSITSCITPVYACDGWKITTIEGLGNQSKGCSKIQKRLVDFHGTQCGYCTPGFVMNMHSLLESKENVVTMKDVEDSFDGNICRCTGYRPILDAFKSMAVDATPKLRKKCADIEDCASCPCPMRNGVANGQNGCSGLPNQNIILQLANGSEWVTATDLPTVFETVRRFTAANKKWRVVAGNTGTGVYKKEGPYNAYVELTRVPELKLMEVIQLKETILGAGLTLTQTIEFLTEASSNKGFKYLKQISSHLLRVANFPVRNNGTIGGNVMIKHTHREFPSDVFVLLETVGATVDIASDMKSSTNVLMSEFLKNDMTGKVLISIRLPYRDDEEYRFKSFKITRRYQNAHAYVNAGFLFRIKPHANSVILAEKPTIVYGGIHPEFVHASETESYFEKNPDVGDIKVMQGALVLLDKEVKPDYKLPEAHPFYRKGLAQSLLYKCLLDIMREKVGPKLRSGAVEIPRDLRNGKQSIEPENSESSLYKEMPKIEAMSQVTGEADFIPDIPTRPDEMFGVFVQSTIGCGTMKCIDPSEALKVPGVATFISAKDIPGHNDFMKFHFIPTSVQEPVFAEDKVSYFGQALGLIVAKSRIIALEAVKKVRVEYVNVEGPVVDVFEAYQKAEKEEMLEKQIVGSYKSRPNTDVDVEHEIEGEWRIGGQYHFHMELQNCLCIPTADGLDVYSGTQWMDHVQNILSGVLAIPTNHINVHVKRLGGGFGGKLTRPAQIAAACAVAAYTIRKPVRVQLDLETNMSLVGKRAPFYMKYKAGFDSKGRIGQLDATFYGDVGATPNDMTSIYAVEHMQNVYKAVGWELKAGFLLTNTPSNTTFRAPGSLKGIALIEYIMEHIAHKLNKDPWTVREANFISKGDPLIPIFDAEAPFDTENLIPTLMTELHASADYAQRKLLIEKFNQENRWKKRGLAVVPSRYPLVYILGKGYPATVAIYHYDGHVACSHGGIEMGQGLNTKVAQTIAHSFRIPIEKVKIKPSNSFVGANGISTGGSTSSELCCFAAMKACDILKERLKPVLEKMESPSWENLIAEAHKQNINLAASYRPRDIDGITNYNTWILALTEVEIDVLTGDYKVVRTDLIEDAGKSLSPGVDLGQIEGGYVQGQGLWTTEKIVHCPETGELLTKRTWDYKPPEPKDIPEDLRITLLKNAPNPDGILRSKAVGEPVVASGVVVLLALKNAIAAARKDKGHTEWFRIDGPVTPEDVHRLCLTSSADFVL